jgi:hypothetical protein
MVREGSAQPASPITRAGTRGDVVRHRLHYHRTLRDARAMANFDIAEDFRTGADHHALADLGMAVAVLAANSGRGSTY